MTKLYHTSHRLSTEELRTGPGAIRGPAATLVLALSAEGDHLPTLLAACANEEWMRSCAVALTYSLEAAGRGRGEPAGVDRDAHVQECLCVLLQVCRATP